jgi:hypothetical protein
MFSGDSKEHPFKDIFNFQNLEGHKGSDQARTVIKKFPAFMESKGSFQSSQKPGSGQYPEPDESNPHPPILFP